MRSRHFLAGAMVLLLAGTAAAHHSAVMFDAQQRVKLNGTVREFQWTNPHCYIQLLVKNDRGQEEEWSLEMGGPHYIYSRGWRPSTVKAGDRVSVTINPLRRGGKGGLVIEVRDAGGTMLGARR